MKYLKRLAYIDYLIILTFLPFFPVLPLLVKIFVVVGLYFVVKKQTLALWIFGGLSILLSFSIFNLFDFREYIKLLVSLLIWGVYLQKTKGDSFFLKLTPLLLFGISVVFFQNVYMLFYLLFEIYAFLVLIMLEYFEFKEAIKRAAKLYVLSLPLVIVLFLFFPRIHQKHFIFGFSEKAYNSGFSEKLAVTSEVRPTKIPVVEFKLSTNYPAIYLRGEVLNEYKNGVWVRGKGSEDEVVKLGRLEVYYLKEYPNTTNHIFAIDLPIESSYGKIDKNYILRGKTDKLLFFQLTSAIDYELAPKDFPFSDFEYDKSANPKAQKIAKKFKKLNEKERLKAIEEFFKSQKIVYSLKTKLDSKNIVDSLFEIKRGYCTHFASAFCLFSRMSGLGCRVVNGFLAKNGIKGYYKVYSKDAHAWCEVLVDGKWVRVDPTRFAYKVEANLNKKDLDYYVSYVRFLIEEWILRYDAFKQKRFFEFFKRYYWVIFGFLMFVLLIFVKIRKKHPLTPIFKILGYPKNETIYSFLSKFNNEKLNEIRDLYYKIEYYKAEKKDLKKLKRLINEFKRDFSI